MKKKSKKKTVSNNKKDDDISLLLLIKVYAYFIGYAIWGVTKAFIDYFKSFKDASLKGKLEILIFFLPFGFVGFKFAEKITGELLLKSYGIKTKAVVTSTVIHSIIRPTTTSMYLYKFEYKGKEYRSRSYIMEEEDDRIGDTIDVVYLDFWPSMSRPSNYFD